jgi:hypothetical protein
MRKEYHETIAIARLLETAKMDATGIMTRGEWRSKPGFVDNFYRQS